MAARRLIIRLSSLGDVILASSALQTPALSQGGDWVVAREFSGLLRGHPRLRTLWEYDRKSGLKGWVALCRRLWDEGYDEVIDLHLSLRTAILRGLFFYWSVVGRSGKDGPPIRRISKQRLRLYGYFLLKELWPKSLRPMAWVRRYALRAGGTGEERPDLSHLVGMTRPDDPAFSGLQSAYFCVMPGSKWAGKRWPASRFVEAIRGIARKAPGHSFVVMGSDSDVESRELEELLRSEELPLVAGTGRWNLTQTARVLSGSQGYLGNDTGLAHLAEAVGVRSVIVFGPTHEGMGFGPWRPESRSVGAKLWCRPCGKDGRFCFRWTDRYSCLGRVEPEAVARAVVPSDASQGKLMPSQRDGAAIGINTEPR